MCDNKDTNSFNKDGKSHEAVNISNILLEVIFILDLFPLSCISDLFTSS